MWGAVIRFGYTALMWLGTASTGWFISDWFNETNTTAQADATADVATSGGHSENKSWWTQKRVIALALGVIGLVLWARNNYRLEKKGK